MPAPIVATALLLLATAAWSDIASRRIPNWISGALVAVYALGALLAPAATEALGSLAVAGVVFGVASALFAWGKLGGGDVKLLTAVALFAGAGRIAELLLMIALAGGALALALLLPRRFPVLPAPIQGRLVQAELPYGVAIAAGAAWILAPQLHPMT